MLTRLPTLPNSRMENCCSITEYRPTNLRHQRCVRWARTVHWLVAIVRPKADIALRRRNAPAPEADVLYSVGPEVLVRFNGGYSRSCAFVGVELLCQAHVGCLYAHEAFYNVLIPDSSS